MSEYMKKCLLCGEPTDNPEKICQECREDIPDDKEEENFIYDVAMEEPDSQI